VIGLNKKNYPILIFGSKKQTKVKLRLDFGNSIIIGVLEWCGDGVMLMDCQTTLQNAEIF